MPLLFADKEKKYSLRYAYTEIFVVLVFLAEQGEN